ncbi:MAG: hypothetical protein QOK48_3225 [Blastocatellia bacterium]|nr:hypothetical protein [Blastocatellia bacterium]
MARPSELLPCAFPWEIPFVGAVVELNAYTLVGAEGQERFCAQASKALNVRQTTVSALFAVQPKLAIYNKNAGWLDPGC